jgi:hypothetical protein
VYRGFNISDAVPMVPIFPFIHAPYRSEGALVGESMGLISIGAHSMDNSYAPAVQGKSWAALQLRAKTTPMSVDQLLDQAAEAVRIPGAGIALHILGRVLSALLKLQNAALGTAAVTTMTVLDRLAWMLVTCARVSVDMAERVERFITYLMRFMGRSMQKGTTLTTQFGTYVLNMLRQNLERLARAALQRGD